MGYVLYGDVGSGSAMVEMALAEAGQPVELREVTLKGDRQLAASYRALNPMGRLPTLVLPDGTVMTESLAILLTIADLHPQAALLPAPGAERATALRWMTLLAAEGYPHITRRDYPARFTPDPTAQRGLKVRALAMYREIMDIIERHAGLGDDPARPFLLGERFSVADIPLAVMSRWARGREWTPKHCPRIEALAQAVAARPAIAPLWRKHQMQSAA